MEDETLFSRLIFSDKATFQLSGSVSRHKACICGQNIHTKQLSTKEIPSERRLSCV